MKKKRFKWKLIVAGIFLILFAAYLVVNTMGLIPGSIPIFKIALSLLLLFTTICGFGDFNFFEILMPLAIIACLFRSELQLDTIPYWMIVLVTALVALGASLIKRSIVGRKKAIYINNDGETVIDASCQEKNADAEFTCNDAEFTIKGAVGDQTHYINSDAFRRGKINGGVGDISLYFIGESHSHQEAYLDIRGGVGDIRVHIPASWRAVTNGKPGLGDIKINGTPNGGPDSPILNVDIVGGVGDVKLYFE